MNTATAKRNWPGLLKEIVEQTGKTRSYLAQSAGFTYQSWSRWENGWCLPSAMGENLLRKFLSKNGLSELALKYLAD